MEQLKRIIATLNWKQQIGILLATAAAGLAIAGLIHWRKEADFKPLYRSLAPEDAGAMVQKLKETGVQFRLEENGSAILAPSSAVAELRLELANAGLPRSGRIGFELFDKTTFGVTDFAEQVNYRRALEGELERSVMSLAEVEHARVHVSFSKDSVFVQSRQPAKASVMVRLRPGRSLTPQNVTAVAHLISSAVEGLAPESVSVLDMRGNLLSRPKRPSAADGQESSDALADHQQKLEKDLTDKINANLEPLLGAGKFQTGVAVDCDFSSGEQSEESFDPSRSVMVTSQKTEDVNGASAAAGGIPGTASNLPKPNTRTAGGNAGFARRTENIAYQSSRTVRRVKLPQGAVKRLSVSVLVDHGVRWEKQESGMQKVLVPPSTEKMQAIRELVAGVAGLQPDRGDKLIVESLPFDSTLNQEPPTAPNPAPPPARGLFQFQEGQKPDRIAVLGAAGAVSVLLLAVMLLMRRRKRPLAAAHVGPSALPPGAAAHQDYALTAQGEGRSAAQESPASKGLQPPAASVPLGLPPGDESKVDTLLLQLREAAVKDVDAYAGVLRGWLAER